MKINMDGIETGKYTFSDLFPENYRPISGDTIDLPHYSSELSFENRGESQDSRWWSFVWYTRGPGYIRVVFEIFSDMVEVSIDDSM